MGTFLPWLRSGRATRNSYEATGAVRRLIHPPGPVDALFRVWPALGVVCALAVACYLLGLRTTATAVAVLAAAAAASAAVAALAAPTNAYASVIRTGPGTTVAGSAMILISAVAQLVLRAAGRVREEPQ